MINKAETQRVACLWCSRLIRWIVRARRLSFAPMKFAAQYIEEFLPILLSYQSHAVLRQLTLDTIATSNRNTYLTVHGQEAFFRTDGDDN